MLNYLKVVFTTHVWGVHFGLTFLINVSEDKTFSILSPSDTNAATTKGSYSKEEREAVFCRSVCCV